MRFLHINYNKIDGRPNRWRLIDQAILARQVPRLIVRCRLTGHRPVVDGTPSLRSGGAVDGARRWVVCDRCGARPYPQGDLDPRFWQIGDRYTGPWDDDGFTVVTTAPAPEWMSVPARTRLPGVWTRLRGGVGAHLRVGDGYGTGIEIKIGWAGSEHTLGLRLRFGRLGFLYLHTERLGMWLQRRFNRDADQSKTTGVSFSDGVLRWAVHAPTGGGELPRWRYGHVELRRRGQPRRVTTLAGHVKRTVRLPEADYIVNLHLHPPATGAAAGAGGRHRLPYYQVDWSTCSRAGIPTTGPNSGRVAAGKVEVTSRAVNARTWPAEAITAITASVGLVRADAGWTPPVREKAPVP